MKTKRLLNILHNVERLISELCDRVHSLSLSLSALSENTPRVAGSVVVVWGVWGIPSYKGSGVWGIPSYKGSKSVCFSIPLEPNSRHHARDYCAEFIPQRPFQLKRWLLLGPGSVRDVVIGQNVQTPSSTAATGVTGRYGEGDFDVADVGQRLAFLVTQ